METPSAVHTASFSCVSPRKAIIIAICAPLQMMGAAYERKNRRWLLSTPRHQALITSRPVPGKMTRTRWMVSSRVGCEKPPAMRSTTCGAKSDAERDQDGVGQRQQPEDRARDAVGLVAVLACPAATHTRG